MFRPHPKLKKYSDHKTNPLNLYPNNSNPSTVLFCTGLYAWQLLNANVTETQIHHHTYACINIMAILDLPLKKYFSGICSLHTTSIQVQIMVFMSLMTGFGQIIRKGIFTS